MVVNYYNRNRVDIRVEAEYNAHFVAYETLLRESDVVVICVPLNDTTRHMISTTQFEKMKQGVVVVNIARGPIIDEAALVAALDSGKVCLGMSDPDFFFLSNIRKGGRLTRYCDPMLY